MKLGAGFLATILAAIVVCVIALFGLIESEKLSHVVLSDYAQDLILAGRLRAEEESRVATSRGFLITGDRAYLGKMDIAQRDFMRDLVLLQKSGVSVPHDKLLSDLKSADDSYQRTLAEFIQARAAGVQLKDLIRRFENRLQPEREKLEKSVDSYIAYTRLQLEGEKAALSKSNRSIFHLVIAASLIALALAGAMAFVITKTLSRLYSEVQDAAKMREEIVEMVAHDLRNPIAAVILSAQLLLRMAKSKNTIDSEEIRQRAENIKRATDRVNGLIGGLLDLARMKAGTLTIEAASVSTNEIFADVFELFQNIAREKGVVLEIQQVPLASIFCDFERIVQVFSNLIGNALKFSAPNQKIVFGTRLENGAVVFFVADQGPGISEEEQLHVFERYWQAGTHKKAGAGLGLAICKGIIAAHGGKIWVTSHLGFGATFYFTIPNGSMAPARQGSHSSYQALDT